MELATFSIHQQALVTSHVLRHGISLFLSPSCLVICQVANTDLYTGISLLSEDCFRVSRLQKQDLIFKKEKLHDLFLVTYALLGGCSQTSHLTFTFYQVVLSVHYHHIKTGISYPSTNNSRCLGRLILCQVNIFQRQEKRRKRVHPFKNYCSC